MPTAQALAVLRIQRRAAVPPFDDMVGEHAMLRRCTFASSSPLHPLATVACTLKDSLAPLAMVGRQQFGIRPLRGRLDRARVHRAQANPHDLELRHGIRSWA